MAAKKIISWPLNTTIQAQMPLLAAKYKLTESAKTNQILAESANADNRFHRLLKGSQLLVAAKTCHQEQNSSVKIQLENGQKNQLSPFRLFYAVSHTSTCP
jgi:hypothetical protein